MKYRFGSGGLERVFGRQAFHQTMHLKISSMRLGPSDTSPVIPLSLRQILKRLHSTCARMMVEQNMWLDSFLMAVG